MPAEFRISSDCCEKVTQ